MRVNQKKSEARQGRSGLTTRYAETKDVHGNTERCTETQRGARKHREVRPCRDASHRSSRKAICVGALATTTASFIWYLCASVMAYVSVDSPPLPRVHWAHPLGHNTDLSQHERSMDDSGRRWMAVDDGRRCTLKLAFGHCYLGPATLVILFGNSTISTLMTAARCQDTQHRLSQSELKKQSRQARSAH